MKMPDFQPQPVEMMARFLSQFGRVGATRIYQFPDIPDLDPGATSQQAPVTFRTDGACIAFYGGCIAAAGAVKFAELGIRLVIGGSEDIMTDGQSGAFVPAASLFGNATNWFPLNRKVFNGQTWQVQYKNRSAGNTISGALVQLAILEQE